MMSMTNFGAFNKTYLTNLINPFVPGMAEFVTPISYLAHTPDIFLFHFRTTGEDGVERFFVTVQYDYLSDPDKDARQIINKWLGVTIERPIAVDGMSDSELRFVDDTDNIYKSRLYLVSRPSHLEYWSSYVVVTKESDLEVELADYTEGQREQVAKVLAEGPDDRAISVHRRGSLMDMVFSE